MKNEFKWADEQIEALEKSIEHWEDIVEGKTDDARDTACPCCALYAQKSDEEHRNCVGCPISASTGLGNCTDTPWNAAHQSIIYKARTFDRKTCTQRELDFLNVVLEAGR